MAKAQFFETTVVDTDAGLSAQFIVVPSKYLPVETSPEQVPTLAELLGLEIRASIDDGWLTRAVTASLAAEGPDFLSSWPSAPPQADNSHFSFAEYLTMAQIVPFEQSPLSDESIGNLFTKASSVGVGAFAGFVVAGGSPLIFVTVPAGMILFGASAGIARGLEEGLRAKIVDLFHRKRG